MLNVPVYSPARADLPGVHKRFNAMIATVEGFDESFHYIFLRLETYSYLIHPFLCVGVQDKGLKGGQENTFQKTDETASFLFTQGHRFYQEGRSLHHKRHDWLLTADAIMINRRQDFVFRV